MNLLLKEIVRFEHCDHVQFQTRPLGVETPFAFICSPACACPQSGPKRDTILPFDFLVQRWRVVPKHNFKIGQRLFLARPGGLNVPDGAYVVVKRSPMRDGEFEYQIKSVTEPDERVVRESQLRPNPWRNTSGRRTG